MALQWICTNTRLYCRGCRNTMRCWLLVLLLLLHLSARLCHILHCGLQVVHLPLELRQLLIQPGQTDASGAV